MKFIVIVLITNGWVGYGMRPQKRLCTSDRSTWPSVWSRAAKTIAVTTQGRVIEQYNEAIIAETYGSEFARVVPSLILHDRKYSSSIPQKNLTSEGHVQQRINTTLFDLDDVLARSTQSVIYETAFGGVGFMIKYQANCLELDFARFFTKPNYDPQIHPAIVEGYFASKASRFGLGPRVYFVSPATSVCSTQAGVCDFRINHVAYNTCVLDKNSSLRFIVLEKLSGETLEMYKQSFEPNGVVPIDMALDIGEQLIALVEKLHKEAQIVHGDIHAANIMIREDGGNITLKLIDFARSSQNVVKPILPIRTPYFATHCLFSPWEIAGYSSAPRDDIARAVQAMARLLFPFDYGKHEESLSALGAQAILRWKRALNFFQYRRYNLVGGLPHVNSTQRAEFNSLLAQVAKLVQSMDHQVNTVPPYAELRDALTAARRIVVSPIA